MISEKIYNLLPAEMPKYIGDLPSAPEIAVAIKEYNSGVGTEYFATSGSVFSPVVKIVIRHTSYELGSAWSEQIKEALHKYHDDFFLSILIVGTPIYLGRDEQKLHEFQVTFKTQVKE